MTATIYKWSDPGAPQFVDNDPASNLAILKAVLIDGYGSRTPVGGWTLAFEDVPGGIACFQSGAVGAPVLQITASTQEQGVSGRGFATMSSATVGTGKFPSNTQVPGAQDYRLPMRSSTVISFPDNQWYMIVDDLGEYIYFIGDDLGTVPGCFFFGKMDFPVELERRWVIAGVESTTINSSNCDDPLFLNNFTGAYSNIPVTGAPGDGDRLTKSQLFLDLTQPNLIDGRAYFVKPWYRTTTGSSYIGTLPGFLILCGLNNNIFNGNKLMTLNGQKYLFFDTAIGNVLFSYDND